MQNVDNDNNFLDTRYLQEAMTACCPSRITHEDVLLLLFRHSAKNLNAPEQRPIDDTFPPAARDSSEVVYA